MKTGRISGMAMLFLGICLLAAFLLGVHLYMERGRPTLDVMVSDAVLENDRFSMKVSQGGNSGTSFRRSRYAVEDDTLYVTLFSGLVYGNFRQGEMTVQITDPALENVRQVCLRKGSTEKLVMHVKS